MRIGDEQRAAVNGIELAYQALGEPDGEPIVLVMGLATQLIHWDLGFCELLAEQGFRVVRFDNRDIGHSTYIDRPVPGRAAMLLGSKRGLAYSLEDMADDLAGLIEHLGLDSAHVVGASQGGMIAQVLGYRRPELVRSLGLIMTGSGKRISSLPRLRALGMLLSRPPRDRAQYIHAVMRTFKVIGSPAYPPDERRLRELVAEGFDRGHNPAGVARQLHAVTASGDRSRRLRQVRAPTVVIHGDRDPLVRPAAGRSVAAAIPGARLVMIPGMGHDLPRELWPLITGELVANARRVAPGASDPVRSAA
jgi:pimeloyl-ACP methyl ester carboxylesterase